jgi:hypothetical protein
MSVSLSDEKEQLQKFAMYVFPKEAVEIRSALHGSIVETVLFFDSRASIDRKTIRNEVERRFGLGFEQTSIDSAIDESVKEGNLKERNGRFYLAGPRKNEIGKILERRRKLQVKLEKTFLSACRAEWKSQDSGKRNSTALNYLYKFLSRLFLSESSLLCEVLRCSEKDVSSIKHYEPPRKILNDTIAEVEETDFRGALERGCMAIFKQKDTIEFLDAVGRNHLYFQILNIDPQCRLYQKKMFSEKVLLLDTNFIIKLLLPTAQSHEVAVRCADLSLKLGVQLQFTKTTKEEYLYQLAQSNRRFRELPSTRLDTLLSLDDDFIASYASEKQKNPRLEWGDFHYKYRAFETLLNRWGIAEYRQALPPFEVYEEETRNRVASYVLTCAKSLTKFIKSDSVSHHDAYNLLLVRKLRESETPSSFGPKFWFLTFDNTLLCVDKAINDEIFESLYDAPSSVECWAWTELVGPYFGPKIDANLESFSDRMRSQFSLIPARIETRKLIAIQTPNVNFDLLSPEQIRKILSDIIIEELWKKTEDSRAVNPWMANKYRRDMKKRAEHIAGKILAKKVQLEIGARIVSAMMAVITLIFALLCATSGNSVGAVILGVLSVVFIAISVGYSRFELILEKTRAKLSFSR